MLPPETLGRPGFQVIIFISWQIWPQGRRCVAMLWELMLWWKQTDWRRMTYESYDESGETCGISTCLKWNSFHIQKGFEEYETKGETGPQSEWNMCAQRTAGPTSSKIQPFSWNGFSNLLIVPGTLQRKKEEQKYLEVRMDKVRASTQNIMCCFCRLEIPWKLCHQIRGGILTCGWRMTPRRMRFLAWFRPWYMGEMFREWFQHRVCKFTKHQGHTYIRTYQDIQSATIW